jgi:hypothetical protein
VLIWCSAGSEDGNHQVTQSVQLQPMPAVARRHCCRQLACRHQPLPREHTVRGFRYQHRPEDKHQSTTAG